MVYMHDDVMRYTLPLHSISIQVTAYVLAQYTIVCYLHALQNQCLLVSKF